jgi:hypothetical protein
VGRAAWSSEENVVDLSGHSDATKILNALERVGHSCQQDPLVAEQLVTDVYVVFTQLSESCLGHESHGLPNQELAGSKGESAAGRKLDALLPRSSISHELSFSTASRG